MTPEEMLEHCLAKPGAWPDNPWDHEHPVVKVHDKIFAFIGGDGVGREVAGPTARWPTSGWTATPTRPA